MSRPVIAIPMGDPAGIGPEILIKALTKKELYEIARPVAIGDLRVLEKIDGIVKSGLKFHRISSPKEGKFLHGWLDVISLDKVDAGALKYGQVQAAAGKAAFEYIKEAARLAMEGEVNALATTPINKEAIRAAGIDFIGHTEMLAELTGTADPLTMFQVRNLRVFFLTRHVSLVEACRMVKADRLVSFVQRCDRALKMLGCERRKIAIAGLNPHSGEHGLFGDEEVKELEPAVKTLTAMGLDVAGPVSADSVFYLALTGKFDAVISLYHDQGHIATKMVDFERTISLTIGMPFLRTSVDHGTAFDIAGKGLASSVSMEEAIRLAAEYSPRYGKGGQSWNNC